MHCLNRVEYEEEARMLQIGHSRSVYRLLIVGFSLVFCAQLKADDSTDKSTDRLTNRQNPIVNQSTSRKPAAIHTESSDSAPVLRPQNLKNTSPEQHSDTSNQSSSSFPNRPVRSPSVLESVLKGHAEKMVGNFSPTRDRKGNSQSETLPLKTKVYIFKGKIKSSGNPVISAQTQGLKVFSIVNTDDQGLFQLQLPAGEYTLFLEIEDGKLYRNSFDGQGNFSTVKILDGQEALENLTDSRDATF